MSNSTERPTPAKGSTNVKNKILTSNNTHQMLKDTIIIILVDNPVLRNFKISYIYINSHIDSKSNKI
jgi:hypothetical protein